VAGNRLLEGFTEGEAAEVKTLTPAVLVEIGREVIVSVDWCELGA
jgi:hypothetical protein